MSEKPMKTSAFVHERVQEISQLVERAAPEGRALDLLDAEVRRKLAPFLQRAPEAAVRLAMLSDCLVVAEQCTRADGDTSEAELAWMSPLVRDAAPYFEGVRETYRAIDAATNGPRAFLDAHAQDPMVFGGSCRATSWIGLDLCKQAALRAGEPEALVQYERLISRVLEDLRELGGPSEEEVLTRQRLAALLLRTTSIFDTSPSQDGRLIAFVSPEAPEVFHAVASASQVYEADRFDVELIHHEARELFERTLTRVVEPARREPGRMLLILGESGSGKTHLMRAFRTVVHRRRLGFAAYLQMTVGSDDYARYLLGRIIDSLQAPHALPEVEQSSLSCLSDALAERLEPLDRASLAEDDLGDAMLGQFVHGQVDALLRLPGLDALHPDVLRAMLYLQRRDAPVTSRVLKFLRCEALSPREQQMLGDLAPWTRPSDPARMIVELAGLIAATGQGALVLLVDQLEDLQNLGAVGERFRRALDVLRHVVEERPNALVVTAGLEEFYATQRGTLPGPVRDRLERDPEPHRLATHRNAEEVEAMISRRLEVLYDACGARFRDDDPLYPFSRAEVAQLAQLRTRDVLDRCRRHRERCMEAGQLAAWTDEAAALEASAESSLVLSVMSDWNDRLASARAIELDDDDAIAMLLASALSDLAAEGGPALEATARGRYVEARDAQGALLVAVCNASPKGGGLGRQVEELGERAKASGATPVIVRCSEFPRDGRTKIVAQLGALISAGGRRVTIGDGDLRAIDALARFAGTHGSDASFKAFRREEQPLRSLPSIAAMAGSDPLEPRPERTQRPATVPPPPAPPAPPSRAIESAPAAPAAVAREGGIRVGTTRGLTPHTVDVAPASLVTHAAFLGSTGSGKTTLALRLIEGLAMRGVPSLLIDRKGDLAIYAADEAWETPLEPAAAAERARLRAKLHVDVFTPGNPSGRPLAIPLVPVGLGALPIHERSLLAGYAASSLGAMMGLRPTNHGDKQQIVILQKAIELLAAAREAPPSLPDLLEVLGSQDPALVAAIGRLDLKHFSKLEEHLEVLRIQHGRLLGGTGEEELDPARLFSPHGDRTRMTVISTKFLGDASAIEFWITRLLVTLTRWSSQSPSSSLRGVMLLDEADLYMPATRKPPTKEPLQDLLRRARSAGLGILLATQSQGDLDYKGRDNIRSWWVGRVSEATAVEKMKSLLSEARVQIGPKLAGLSTGEFFQVSGGQVVELRGDRSLLKTEQLGEDRIEALARRSRG